MPITYTPPVITAGNGLTKNGNQIVLGQMPDVPNPVFFGDADVIFFDASSRQSMQITPNNTNINGYGPGRFTRRR